MVNDVQHVFIVGSKGIPGNYGGYETFVDKLTEYHEHSTSIAYHVACKSDHDGDFEYHGAHCFQVKVPNIGSAQAIWYDVEALRRSVAYIRKHEIPHPIVYVLACRIGPFCAHFEKVIHKLGGKLFVNPDGHEWMRAKWSKPVRMYWKQSERMMAAHCDLLVCDSRNIESYIRGEYERCEPSTTFIPYGAETRKSSLRDDDEGLLAWYAERGLSPKSYYLVVGRFVPENNYETMIREFMRSASTRDFVLITNASAKFLEGLRQRIDFDKDPRIKFVGTVYDQELLMKIRENAYAYIHGHEVGGTNPSLLEALSSTELNLLLDVGFNREVAEGAALYWSKEPGDLASLIERADALSTEDIVELASSAKTRIGEAYNWKFISDTYEALFTASGGNS